MRNGKAFFLLMMGMIVTLYTAFAVIGQDAADPAADSAEVVEAVPEAGDADGNAAVASEAAEGVAGNAEPVAAEDAGAEAAETAAAEEETATETPAEGVPVAPEESIFVGVEADEGEIPGADATKEDEKGTISISLDDVEMADVVRMFTRISGANIIASPSNLVGRVTANLDDVNWQSAMETILDMHGLALTESPPGSKIFRIDPKVPGAPEPMKVKTFFLKYAQVSNSVSVVSSMLVPGATLQPFSSRNALVVRSTSSNLGEIEEIINSIDVLRDQVFIEAKFMELNDTAIRDLGINWQVLQGYNVGVGSLAWNVSENRNWDKSRTDSETLTETRDRQEGIVKGYDGMNNEYDSGLVEQPDVFQTLVAGGVPTYSYADVVEKNSEKSSNIADSFSKGIADVRTAVLGVDDFRLVLSALKQMDGVQVVSNPKIIVANEEPALIHIGQEERPFESTITPATQTTAPLVTYNPGAPVQLGVKLKVTPTINTASNITVRIEPELTRFVRDSVAPNGQTYPIIGKKTIQTVFCLESGKTVAIGGLTETMESEAVKKIPLLGDIPLIGKYLFSHSHMEKEQKETIIFVTVGLAYPEHVNEMDGLPEDTELTHQKLLHKRLRRQEFGRDLEKSRQEVEDSLQKSERVKYLLKSK